MKKYLLKLFLFFLPFLAVILISILYFGKYLTAPKVTNSISLNEKLYWFNNRKADYLAIGSSLSLNDINSDEIVKNVHSTSYLNISAWGLKIADTYRLLTTYCKFHKPKVVIMVTNVTDFKSSGTAFDQKEVTAFWSSSFLKRIYSYFKHFDLEYYYTNSINNFKLKTTDKDYSSLVYDNYGAVLLSNDSIKHDKERLETNYIINTIDPSSYLYLDSLCNLLRSNNIKLFFIYTPIQTSKIVASSVPDYVKYRQQAKQVIEKYKFNFFDANYTNWPDSLFADPAHMRKRGSIAFTDTFLNRAILPNLHTN